MSVELFINRRKFEVAAGAETGGQLLAVGDYGPDYNLYLLKGEGDPTGGELIGRDQVVELKNGMHFRAIPGNANFGHID